MDERMLREKARAALASGRLPNRRQDRTWGGPGVGAPCEVCSLPVRVDEMEFEIEFAHDPDDPGLDKYHVHVSCFVAWELERDGTRPTCDVCLMRVRMNQPVVFREDGRLEHVQCPEIRCIRCLRLVHAGELTRRIGDDVAHRLCNPEPPGKEAPVDTDGS
jgi:hypothetical protein